LPLSESPLTLDLFAQAVASFSRSELRWELAITAAARAQEDDITLLVLDLQKEIA